MAHATHEDADLVGRPGRRAISPPEVTQLVHGNGRAGGRAERGEQLACLAAADRRISASSITKLTPAFMLCGTRAHATAGWKRTNAGPGVSSRLISLVAAECS